MIIYLSIVGSKKVREFQKKWGCGWCLTPDNNRENEGPYFLDNGAFAAYKNTQQYDPERFYKLLQRFPDYDFAVVPDIVCGGLTSLKWSLSFMETSLFKGPAYLAVQDGMKASDVIPFLDKFQGIFVGGSIPWKMQTMRMWSDYAHLYKLKCHVGRIGTYEGFIQAHFAGVDSVDTTTPSRHQNDYHIRKYYEHLQFQSELGSVTA